MNDNSPATRGELNAMGAELLATKAELKKDISDLRVEIVGAVDHVAVTLGGRIDQLQAEMGTMRTEMGTMRAEMAAMPSALSRELAGHVRAAAEENRQFLAGSTTANGTCRRV